MLTSLTFLHPHKNSKGSKSSLEFLALTEITLYLCYLFKAEKTKTQTKTSLPMWIKPKLKMKHKIANCYSAELA